MSKLHGAEMASIAAEKLKSSYAFMQPSDSLGNFTGEFTHLDL